MAMLFRWASLIFMLIAASCGGGGDGHIGSAVMSGGTRLDRVGAPTCGFDHVYVTVEKVRIDHGTGPVDLTLPSPRRIDLMGLGSGVLAAVGAAPLPAGHYTQVRLVLAANSEGVMANAVLRTDGTLAALSTPGAQQSGLKLQAEFDVAAGQSADLLLNLDPCQSVTQAGNSGQYLLSPVLVVQPVDAARVARGEFRVNTTTAGNQDQPAVTAMNDGGYLVTWFSDSHDGTGKDVYAQRFDATGAPQGGELRLAAQLRDPAVAAWPDGGFVVTWTGVGSNGLSNIYVQRFDARGTPLGSPAQVNDTVPFGGQAFSFVAVLADGGFAVGWRTMDYTYGIGVQRFDASGVRVGGLIQVVRVPITSGGSDVRGRIFALPDGGFMVAWNSRIAREQFGARYIDVQRFDAAGNPVTAPTRIASSESTPLSTGPALADRTPGMAALDNGDFQVVWSVGDRDGTGWNVYTQRLDRSGALVGSPVRVNSTTAGNQDQPAIAASDGGYVVTWASEGQDGSGYDVYAQRFDAAGNRMGGETLVNSTTAGNQVQPAVAGVAGGGSVIAWASEGQDGSGYGIYAQQFDEQGNAR